MQQLANAPWRVAAPPPCHEFYEPRKIAFPDIPGPTPSIIVGHKLPSNIHRFSFSTGPCFPRRDYRHFQQRLSEASLLQTLHSPRPSCSASFQRFHPPTSNTGTPRYEIDSHEKETDGDGGIACWTGSTAARKFLIKVRLQSIERTEKGSSLSIFNGGRLSDTRGGNPTLAARP